MKHVIISSGSWVSFYSHLLLPGLVSCVDLISQLSARSHPSDTLTRNQGAKIPFHIFHLYVVYRLLSSMLSYPFIGILRFFPSNPLRIKSRYLMIAIFCTSKFSTLFSLKPVVYFQSSMSLWIVRIYMHLADTSTFIFLPRFSSFSQARHRRRYSSNKLLPISS